MKFLVILYFLICPQNVFDAVWRLFLLVVAILVFGWWLLIIPASAVVGLAIGRGVPLPRVSLRSTRG